MSKKVHQVFPGQIITVGEWWSENDYHIYGTYRVRRPFIPAHYACRNIAVLEKKLVKTGYLEEIKPDVEWCLNEDQVQYSCL